MNAISDQRVPVQLSGRPVRWLGLPQSLAARVAFIGAASLVVVLLLISSWLTATATAEGRARAQAWVLAKVSGIAQSIDALERPSVTLAERAYPQLDQLFGDVEFDEGSGELNAHGVTINEGNSTYVDMFARQTQGAAKVYLLRGTAFVPVSSSIKDAKGARLLGDKIDGAHAAFARLKSGQVLRRHENRDGKEMIVRYSPLRTREGQVIGALYAAIDVTEFQKSIEKIAADAKLYESGRVLIVAPESGFESARVVWHPTFSNQAFSKVFPGQRALFDRFAAQAAGMPLASTGLFGSTEHRFAIMSPASSTGWWVIGEYSDEEALADQKRFLLTIKVLLSITSVVLGVGLWAMLRFQVGRPLRQLAAVSEAVASGHLTTSCRSSRQDEIGEIFNAIERLRTTLHRTMTSVLRSSESVSIASAEIASGNQDLSSRSEVASTRLQATASSVAGLSSQLQATASAALTANALAGDATLASARGQDAVARVVAMMGEIQQSGVTIGDITAVIDSIAFQTNILALNAATEAARAGAAGRGFAVVAGEVRTLAQRSADAAKDIKGLIAASTARAQEGTAVAESAQAAMGELSGSVERVVGIIRSIEVDAKAQSHDVQSLESTVSDLDTMIQQNAALVEQSAAAADSLQQQAAGLLGLVRQFRV